MSANLFERNFHKMPSPVIAVNNEKYNYFDYFNLFVQPKLKNYQLLGDSIFVRFAVQVLHERSNFTDGVSSVGFCTSGQRIKNLALKIKKCVYPLHDKVIVLIGTNDVLCGRELSAMISDFNNLLALLKARRVSKIVILTLPPIPRLSLIRKHWEVIRAFNQYLLGIGNKSPDVKTYDILPIFVKFDSPEIAAPPPSSFREQYCNTARQRVFSKRKFDSDGESSETEKKKIVLDPKLTAEEDSNLHDFGRYINRMNIMESVEASINSDDEFEYFTPQKPYIEYYFWNILKKSLPKNLQDDYNVPFASVVEAVNPLNFSLGAPKTSEDFTEESLTNLPDNHKNIIKFTHQFLRLNYFELLMGIHSQRMDMIHPNSAGLHRIHDFLTHLLE